MFRSCGLSCTFRRGTVDGNWVEHGHRGSGMKNVGSRDGEVSTLRREHIRPTTDMHDVVGTLDIT